MKIYNATKCGEMKLAHELQKTLVKSKKVTKPKARLRRSRMNGDVHVRFCKRGGIGNNNLDSNLSHNLVMQLLQKVRLFVY